MLESYLKKIFKVGQRGDAREESFYPALTELFESYLISIGKKKAAVTAQPKKTEAGNPDFRIWDGKAEIMGYIEAKAPSNEHLDQIETSEQLKRYLGTFPNLILTNFYEFRLYRHGTLIDQVLIGRHSIAKRLKTTPPVEKADEFFKLLEKFSEFVLPSTTNAKSLAIELAKRTRFLRDEVIAEELKADKSKLRGFYNAFHQYLISGLTEADFADLYSQTVTYGLFAARTRSTNGFNRKLAYDNIPRTIGILKDVFRFISQEDLPEKMEWIIDDISEVLAKTKVNEILHKFYEEGKGKDPIIHFYETFLAEFDPKTRERRGVYYTPEPVVSYIVRSLHKILKDEFGLKDGFADNSVTVLDPAAGTLTFLAEAAKVAVKEFVEKYGEGGKQKLIKEHILKNFYAFELMMAPYAIGHLKMGFLLEELGYKLRKDDRFKLYLTNTLEMEELTQTELPGMASLSEESRLAGKVKKEQPILVILGNPPYSGISANLSEKKITIKKGQKYITRYEIREDKSNNNYKLVPQLRVATRNSQVKQKTWIGELIEYYKIIDGKWFGERKHWLQDDYVKFIRFAQWKIDQAGEGVIGLITNHSYLDNPTFRGMRQSLMKSFTEIYILDLHGNSLKKEKCPDGSKDENVFDIRQGVTVSIFIKKRKELNTKVFHAELWGLEENKYNYLEKNSIASTKWTKLNPSSPHYFFVPTKEAGRQTYDRFPRMDEVYSVNVTGVVTARDRFVVDIDKSNLKRRIEMFRNSSVLTAVIRQAYNLKDTRGWKLPKVRKQLADDSNWDSHFTKIFYRPFDIRHIYFNPMMVDWPRPEVSRHMMQDNLSLVMPKRVETKVPWTHVLCSSNIVEHVAVSLKTIDYFFPLYLYPDANKHDLFSLTDKKQKKRPNLSSKIVDGLKKQFKKAPKPEEIFYYVYSVLYSNTYRTKYSEFLKIDFPRIPFTKNYELFNTMSELGKVLVNLHLLKSISKPISKFPIKGDALVEKLKYEEKEERVYINGEQYFENVSNEIWEYQIGGYQVCRKWLKDRKKRKLSLDDIKHYCNIVTALKKTVEVQKEIDKIYPEVERDVIYFS